MEEAFVPIECAENATQLYTDDPIAKAWHQTLGKMLEESSFRSRSEKYSTRKGGLIAKAPIKHQEGVVRALVLIKD